jgi:hypothetical protein
MGLTQLQYLSRCEWPSASPYTSIVETLRSIQFAKLSHTRPRLFMWYKAASARRVGRMSNCALRERDRVSTDFEPNMVLRLIGTS